MKKNTLSTSLFIIFIGCLFTFVGIVIVNQNSSQKIENPQEITAIITKLTKSERISGTGANRRTVYTTTPTIKYVVNGKEYSNTLNYYDGSMKEGKEIVVKYDPKNPKILQETTGETVFKFLPMILGIIAVLFGLKSLINGVVRSNNRRNVMLNGEKIFAEYVDAFENMTVNGPKPYIIRCKWTDPLNDKTYIFDSENVWGDPKEFILQNNIDSFEVIINRDDPNQYYVFLENLYKLGYNNSEKSIN